MQTSVKNWATKHCRAQGEFKMVFQLWWALKTIGFVRSIIFLWPCISWATEEMLSLPQHSGCPVECCESDKPAKLTFAALFLVFVYPLFCTLWRNGELIDEATLHLGREMFLKHMQRTVQVVLLVNVKADGNTPRTLLLSLSFFLKFSSVQENPLNWKLAYITTINNILKTWLFSLLLPKIKRL